MSFSFQISDFSGSFTAADIAAYAFTELVGRAQQDFSPPLDDYAVQAASTTDSPDLVADGTLRAWMPSVADLVASVDLSCSSSTTINSFADLITNLTESKIDIEIENKLNYQTSLCEEALTLDDFRHAVDYKLDYQCSLWSNSN